MLKMALAGRGLSRYRWMECHGAGDDQEKNPSGSDFREAKHPRKRLNHGDEFVEPPQPTSNLAESLSTMVMGRPGMAMHRMCRTAGKGSIVLQKSKSGESDRLFETVVRQSKSNLTASFQSYFAHAGRRTT